MDYLDENVVTKGQMPSKLASFLFLSFYCSLPNYIFLTDIHTDMDMDMDNKPLLDNTLSSGHGQKNNTLRCNSFRSTPTLSSE